MREYVPDPTERFEEEDANDRCVVCGDTEPNLYDDNLDVYYCDERCQTKHLSENIDEVIAFYRRMNTDYVN